MKVRSNMIRDSNQRDRNIKVMSVEDTIIRTSIIALPLLILRSR